MEGLRSEVSQKIKKAIQAKLLELGVTIDEELPDYVMVLVVNKKSKEQMEEDLSLFLQGKTNIFVEWLLEILVRLQTMSMQTKVKPAKASHRPVQGTVPAQRNTRKRSPSSAQPESRKRRQPDCAEPPSVAGLQPEPRADGTAGPAAAVDSGPVPAPPTDPQTPAAGEQRPTGQRSPEGSPDPPGRQRSTSRDSPETRHSPEPRRSNSRGSSKSRSTSRESSKPPSKSRDSSGSRRSKSRDSSGSRRSKSRDSSGSRRSKSRDSSESRRSKSRDSSGSRRSESRDPEEPRRSPEGTGECRSRDLESGSSGRRHPRISFPSAANRRDRGRAAAGSEEDPATVDERCRRVPPLHGASPTPPGGRVVNLRQESIFPLGERPSDQQTAGTRRGPQSAISAVRRRPPAEDSGAEDPEDPEEEEEGRRRGAVASTVRVTDRPRPPLHLLPRPAILVKAMRDAQRSTGAAGPGTRRQGNTDGANPAPTAAAAAGKKTRPYVGDLRAKLAASRRLETAPTPPATAAVRSSPRRRAKGRQHR